MELLTSVWNWLPSIFVFFFIFSVLIIVHECGHFFSALKYKVTVEEFGLGIPPRAKILKKKNGIIYSLNWLPFGGFVKMLGEDDFIGKESKKKGSFSSKTPWQRLVIVVAGVTMNFILAITLLTVGYSVGMTPIIVDDAQMTQKIQSGEVNADVIVAGILEDSPASTSGIQTGDIITGIADTDITTRQEIIQYAENHPDATELDYHLIRDGVAQDIVIQLDENGKTGVALDYKIDKVQYNPIRAIWEAIKTTWELSVATVFMFITLITKLITTHQMSESVGGPIMIASMTHQLVQLGEIVTIVKFTALLSISLGVINLLPIPALDGGRAVFILFEMITGKKPNERFEAALHQIFFLLLIALIFLITFKDIMRLS